ASRTSISSEASPNLWNYEYQHTNLITRPLYLKSIKSAMGKIDFTYTNDRQDAGAPKLDRVSLFAKNGTTYKDIRTFHFNYSYFGSPSSNNTYTMRLCLEDISYTPYSSLSNPGPSRNYYTFKYNRDKNLPSRDSDQFDYFGFYTKTDTSFFPLHG